MNTETITAIAMGIALSACCGFRVFVPLFGAGFAAYQHWYVLPTDMQWMASLSALICFGLAAVVEIVAYYFPFVDNLLDTIATPLAVGAGTLLASSFLPIEEFSPLVKWVLELISGGAAAGTIQLGTGLLRFTSSKTTAGMGNAVIATGENAAAIGGTALAFVIPVIVAVLLVVLIGWMLQKILRRIFKKTFSVCCLLNS